jgi:hypothetical protein
MLRYAGQARAECLAYAELFALPEGSFSLEPLFAAAFPLEVSPAPLPGAGCSS